MADLALIKTAAGLVPATEADRELLEAVTPEENRKRAQRFFVSKSTGTHCANGHAWNERSIYVNAKGKRFCRVCRAESMRRSRREGVKNG